MSIGEAATGAFTRMLHAFDLRDWQAVRDAFADHVDTDYRALFGDPPATVAADQLVGRWRAFGNAFDATQHLTGPLVTAEGRDGEVHASTHVRAFHRIAGATGGDTWIVAGHYEVRLVHRRAGWRIVGIALRVFYQEGNLVLPRIAQERSEPPSPVSASS